MESRLRPLRELRSADRNVYMIYAFLFAVVSVLAALGGWLADSATGELIARLIHFGSLAMAIACLALAKFAKRDELPFP